MAADNVRSKVCRPNRPILFPTGQAAEPKSPTHCRGWQPTSDFRKAPDQRRCLRIITRRSDSRIPIYSRPAHPNADDHYGQLSCQGHAVWPSWGIVLPRTWINPIDSTTYDDLTAFGDLTTPQLSAPLMMRPYRVLL